MSAELVRAAVIRSPNDNDTDDDFQGRLFTCGTTVLAHELPAHWHGRWVIVQNEGSAVARIGFSKRPGATFEHTPVAAAAGALANPRIGVGAIQQRKLPDWNPNGEKCYFVRRSAAATELFIELGDGE